MGAGNGSASHAHDLLQHLASFGLHAQKKSFLYAERDPQKREEFLKQVQQIPVAARVYVDEAGIEDTLSYAYGWSRNGWSRKGTRCWAERLGHRTCRISMIAAWCQKQVLAPCTFQGYCDSLLVETWFEQCLLPVLKKGQVVILDNASFHRQAKLRALLLTVGCDLLPLPPYSPDFNKIEPLWNTLKRKIEKDNRIYTCFWDKIDAAFCSL